MKFGSLFAGIGGFDLGFERAGMTCAWQVEKEPSCHTVLRARFPGAKLFDDVRTVNREVLEPVDVICGGFPCQDLSVAGKRAGLEGARSGLFYEMARIIGELEPAFVVWENVPGLLSSARGADFAAVLVALDGLGYSGAWSVLDARYFGVAQRRRRVFGVFARAGVGEPGRRCAEILALAPRLRGNPPPRSTARPGASVASLCGIGIGGADDNDGQANRIVLAGGGMAVAGGGVADPICPGEGKTASNAGNNPRPRNVVVVGTLSPGAHPGGFNGQDAYSGQLVTIDTTQITSQHNRSVPKPGDPCHPLSSSAHAPVVMAVNRESFPVARRGREGVAALEIGSDPVSNALRASGSGSSAGSQVMQPGAATGVRRLTPLECERLQGFPDGWTALPGTSDAARYRMLGNAVAVPCAAWIARGIARALAE